MGDCAETADQLQEETAEEETPAEPDPCVDPAAQSKDEDAERKHKVRKVKDALANWIQEGDKGRKRKLAEDTKKEKKKDTEGKEKKRCKGKDAEKDREKRTEEKKGERRKDKDAEKGREKDAEGKKRKGRNGKDAKEDKEKGRKKDAETKDRKDKTKKEEKMTTLLPILSQIVITFIKF